MLPKSPKEKNNSALPDSSSSYAQISSFALPTEKTGIELSEDSMPLTQTNLVAKIENVDLTTLDIETVDHMKNIVSKYDPSTLLKSLLINKNGEAIPLSFPDPQNIQIRPTPGERIPDDLRDRIIEQTRQWLYNYQEKLAEQHRVSTLRTLTKSDVDSYESDLIGEEGVFADIKRGTVFPFGGTIVIDEVAKKLQGIAGKYLSKVWMHSSEELRSEPNAIGSIEDSSKLPHGELSKPILESTGAANLFPESTSALQEVYPTMTPEHRNIQVYIIGHSLSKKLNTRFDKKYSERESFAMFNAESDLRSILGLPSEKEVHFCKAERVKGSETLIVTPMGRRYDDYSPVRVSKSSQPEIYKKIEDEIADKLIKLDYPTHDPVKNNIAPYFVTVQAPWEKVAPGKSDSGDLAQAETSKSFKGKDKEMASQKLVKMDILFFFAKRNTGSDQNCYVYGSKERFAQQVPLVTGPLETFNPLEVLFAGFDEQQQSDAPMQGSVAAPVAQTESLADNFGDWRAETTIPGLERSDTRNNSRSPVGRGPETARESDPELPERHETSKILKALKALSSCCTPRSGSSRPSRDSRARP